MIKGPARIRVRASAYERCDTRRGVCRARGGARRLLSSAPAICARSPRSCSRPNRSSTCPAKKFAGACISPLDPAGRELCLRPDLTIPVSRDYLASPIAGKVAGFCYLGPVFRHVEDGPERIPAGGHRILRPLRPRRRRCRDARARARGHRPISACPDPDIRMGDVGLFSALDRRARSRARLEAPPGEGFQSQGQPGAGSRPADARRGARRVPNIRACWRRSPAPIRKRAHALVTDLLSIAGITTVGGRTVDEIADRFLDQATLGARRAAARRRGR